MPPVNGGLSSAEFWGTGSKIPLDVKCIQDKVTLLLCDIHNLQDPTTYGPSKTQDPQEPALSNSLNFYAYVCLSVFLSVFLSVRHRAVGVNVGGLQPELLRVEG